MLFALTLFAGTLAALRPAAAEPAPRAGVAVDAPQADSLAASAAELDRLFAVALEKLAAAGLDKPIDGKKAGSSARKAEAGSPGGTRAGASARAAGPGKRADARTAAAPGKRAKAPESGTPATAAETEAATAASGTSASASTTDARAAAAAPGKPASVSNPGKSASAAASGTTAFAAASDTSAFASESGTPASESGTPASAPGTPAASVPRERSRLREFRPRFHRIDREIDRGRFVYRGEVILGMTASYGTLSSEDTDFLTIIDNINLSGTLTSVQPFFGYHYRDNRCVGIRLGYHYLKGDLGNVDLDLGEQNDISLNISEMALKSVSYSFALFHRSYVGIDPRGRLGLFSEVEASVTSGTSDFFNNSGETRKATYSDVLRLKLAFNPGMAIYIFPNVCATVSVGLGGIQYNSVRQHDAEGNRTGSRRASKMRFRLNIADINFGLVIHLWDKKREQ